MQAMNPLGPDHPPVEVKFASGKLYTQECTDEICGRQNGGYILEEGKELPCNTRPCVSCGAKVRWLYVGEMK